MKIKYCAYDYMVLSEMIGFSNAICRFGIPEKVPMPLPPARWERGSNNSRLVCLIRAYNKMNDREKFEFWSYVIEHKGEKYD